MKTKSGNGKLIALIAVLAAVVILAGAIWFFTANVIVGGKVYPRSAEFLNLREEELTVQQYDAIRAKLPECEIYWNIPFQGETYPENTTELTVHTLSDEDLKVLDYFTQLQIVKAQDCTDYPQLTALQNSHPHMAVQYAVTVDGKDYPQSAKSLTITGITDDEIVLLQYLPQLEQVDAKSCDDYTQLAKLQAAYPELALDYAITLCGGEYTTDTAELTLTGMTQEDAELLKHFHGLTTVHLVEPELPAENLLSLTDTYPHVSFTWEKTVLGVTLHSDATEANLMMGISEKGVKAFEAAATAHVSGKRDETVWQFAINSRYPIPNRAEDTQDLIAEVEAAMAYFPNVELVNMNGAFLDNEAMAKFREDHRQDYKVVWTVECGTLAARTDTPYIMPYKYGIAYFFDHSVKNMRYCEDVIAVDIGHMSVHDVSFVEGMPKLKYLILAHTQVSDISPLASCKSLVFLELDWSIVRDYSPLLECTALEDLNVSKTWGDVTPLLQMTWLKRLWLTDRSTDVQLQIKEVFEGTETQLYLNGFYTVGGGWRESENYYAMRDALGMDYMKG